MLFALILTAIVIIAILWKSKRYFAVGFFGLLVLYESMAIVAYKIAYEDYTETLNRLVPGISDAMVLEHGAAIIVFMLMFLFGSLIINNKPFRLVKNKSASVALENITANFSAILLLCFGGISYSMGGGHARLEQYTSNSDVTITSFHFYAITLTPLVWYFALKKFSNKDYSRSLLFIMLSVPAMMDMFIAGRRQMFAPLIFLLFYFLLSNRHLSNISKLYYLTITSLAGVVFFAIQFTLRLNIREGDVGASVDLESLGGGILIPVIGEFIGAGATSLASFRDFVFAGYTEPLGLESWIAYNSQTIPLIGKWLASMLAAGTPLSHYNFLSIAPFGALTVAAESMMLLGFAGLLLYGIIIGMLASILDRATKNTTDASRDSYLKIVLICLASIIIFKYRSGLADIVASGLSSALFYYLIRLLALAYQRLPKKVTFKVSRQYQ